MEQVTQFEYDPNSNSYDRLHYTKGDPDGYSGWIVEAKKSSPEITLYLFVCSSTAEKITLRIDDETEMLITAIREAVRIAST